jgi:menaquinone-specific isochorismate synthase
MASMQVITYRSRQFKSRRDLYQFLLPYTKDAHKTLHNSLISLSFDSDLLDPLRVLQQMAGEEPVHFYLENIHQGRAIAAIGAVLHLETGGSDIHRFAQTQHFIQSSLARVQHLATGSTNLDAPRFFCGFTFFDQAQTSREGAPAIAVLPRWQVVRQQNQCQITANLPIPSLGDLERVVAQLWQDLDKIQQSGLLQNAFQPRSRISPWAIADTNNFKARVQAALQAIHNRHLHKVVLAHAIDVITPNPLRWGDTLHNLRRSHPHCYVFAYRNRQGQSFIGASPERLLSIGNANNSPVNSSDHRQNPGTGGHTLITDALAGSAPRGATPTEDHALAQRLLSSDKEQREHQAVVDFMAERLGHLGLVPQYAAPHLLRLSNIQHLHTPIQAALPTHLHPLEILAELHPTPAVAGVPRDAACDYIRHHEAFERSLYAAPLGWVDARGNAEFIVGIRSALLDGNTARLYAGAGIVAGSDPARELAEVQLKFQPLLQALV